MLTFIVAAVLQQFWLQRWFSVPGFWDAVKRAIPNLLLIHSFIPNGNYYYGFNSVSWYLSDLAFMYLMLPAFLWCVGKIRKNKRVLALTLLVYIVISFLLSNTKLDLKWCLYISPLMRTFDFFIGMLVAKSITEEKNYKQKRHLTEIIGFCFFITALCISWKVPLWMSYSIIYIPGSIMIVWGITKKSADQSILTQFLSWRGFELVNTISLELYLVHQLVINYVETYSTDMGKLSDLKYYLLIVGGTIIISIFLKMNRVEHNLRIRD